MKRTTFVEAWGDAARLLAREDPPPLTLITGESAYPKERLLDAARGAWPGEVEPFSTRPGEKDAAAFQRLLDTWNTPTLFGGARLIVVRGLDGMLKGNRLKLLGARLEGEPPAHRLVGTISALDGRSRLAKLLKKAGGLVPLPPLRDAPPPWHQGGPYLATDLNEWLVQEARLQGLSVSLQVADELSRRVGNEPARLARYLEQLAVLAGERTTLSIDDVRTGVPHSSLRLLGLYEDELRAGRVSVALELVDRMEREGVYDPFMKLVSGPAVADTVLRTLASNLGRVLAAHQRLTPELRASLGAKPWERRKQDGAALDAILGSGGRRVFLERDLRATRPEGARRAFGMAVSALRALRDGEGVSLHATTVRMGRALGAPSR